MIRFAAVVLIITASAALAFTPDHIVVVDGAVVYDEDHNYESDYIIAHLAYWTPVVAEPVGTPESPRTYCLVTLEDGRRGLTEWDHVGWALKAVRDDVPVYERTVIHDDGGAVVATLDKGEVVAFRTGAIECEGIITAERLEGWVRKSDVEPVVPIEEIPPIPKSDG
jgi:hypothetical protein